MIVVVVFVVVCLLFLVADNGGVSSDNTGHKLGPLFIAFTWGKGRKKEKQIDSSKHWQKAWKNARIWEMKPNKTRQNRNEQHRTGMNKTEQDNIHISVGSAWRDTLRLAQALCINEQDSVSWPETKPSVDYAASRG